MRQRNQRQPILDKLAEAPGAVRIIGGTLRGRQIPYLGDARTRPMKDRVREALFNLLGPSIVGTHAIDLFAGTGALGFEAISRGAGRATFFERHFPTASTIRHNAGQLGVEAQCETIAANTLLWFRRNDPRNPKWQDLPWAVFCSPPYELFVSETEAVLAMLQTLVEAAPPRSVFAVEADNRFDMKRLPGAELWSIRDYPPARIAMRWIEEV